MPSAHQPRSHAQSADAERDGERAGELALRIAGGDADAGESNGGGEDALSMSAESDAWRLAAPEVRTKSEVWQLPTLPSAALLRAAVGSAAWGTRGAASIIDAQ